MPIGNNQNRAEKRDNPVLKDTSVHLVPKDRANPTIPTNRQPNDRQTITEVGPDAVLKDNRDKDVPKSTQKKPAKPRSWLKVRLPANQDRALNIVENWRLEKQAAPKVAAAIQLYAAFEAGDIDYVRENHPKIFAALDKSSRKRGTLSLKESDSYTQRSDSKTERESERSETIEPAVDQIAAALQTITGRDRHLNRDVNELAFDLNKADYTAQDIEAWYQRCWPHDWRAVKAAQERRVEQPSLKIIRECIGQVRSLPVDEPEQNPYLADPHFTRHIDDEPEPPVEEIPVWPPEGCNGGAAVKDPLLATLGQLEIQLNRATYDTWLKHAEPIHIAGDRMRGGTLYVSVPHVYCKDWIDRHLLTAMTETFDRIANYSGEKRGRISEELLFKIEIIVEGDPVPGVSNA